MSDLCHTSKSVVWLPVPHVKVCCLTTCATRQSLLSDYLCYTSKSAVWLLCHTSKSAVWLPVPYVKVCCMITCAIRQSLLSDYLSINHKWFTFQSITIYTPTGKSTQESASQRCFKRSWRAPLALSNPLSPYAGSVTKYFTMQCSNNSDSRSRVFCCPQYTYLMQ